jgi:hypothetical protein
MEALQCLSDCIKLILPAQDRLNEHSLGAAPHDQPGKRTEASIQFNYFLIFFFVSAVVEANQHLEFVEVAQLLARTRSAISKAKPFGTFGFVAMPPPWVRSRIRQPRQPEVRLPSS